MAKRVWVLLLPLVLAACASGDPLDTTSGDQTPEIEAGAEIVIGTANFPEAEIIGQIWAAALQDAGFDADVASGIGSREVYLTALEDGAISLVPEYAGNLASFYADLPERADETVVRDTLAASLPDSLEIGEFSPAESADAYRVTQATAAKGIRAIGDLDKLEKITVAAPPEFAERRYGPPGLTSVYGIDPAKITVKPISDGGGPLTVQALVEGAADTANIFTTSPAITGKGERPDLVVLEDPLNLIPPQNVVPVIRSGRLPAGALEVVNAVNAKLTTQDLVEMNLRNAGDERAEPAAIARDWVDAAEL